MAKAIVTRYQGPTNTRGSVIVATAEGGKRPHRIAIPYDHGSDTYDAHAKAARALMTKMGWTGRISGGGLPDGRGYAWVFVDKASERDHRSRSHPRPHPAAKHRARPAERRSTRPARRTR